MCSDKSLTERIHDFKRRDWLCCYTAVFTLFAVLYFVIGLFFDCAFKWNGTHTPVVDELYFSVVTITTLGYGDIIPLAWPLKLLAAMESLLGLLILGLFLNNEAYQAALRRDRKLFKNLLPPIIRDITFILEYSYTGFEVEYDPNMPLEESLRIARDNLGGAPDSIEFKPYPLNQIHHGALHAATGFRMLVPHMSVVSASSSNYINTIIATLDEVAHIALNGTYNPKQVYGFDSLHAKLNQLFANIELFREEEGVPSHPAKRFHRMIE